MQRHALVVLSVALALLAAPTLADTHACSRAANGHWEGHADRDGSSFRLTMDVDADHCLAYVDYPELPVFGIVFEVSQSGSDLRIERRPDVGPATNLALTQSGDSLAGTFTGAGATSAAATFERTDASPHILREEHETFADGSVRLAGTLLLPDGKGLFPAMVVVQASGPENRGWASYRSWGVLLARHGVAALIYDKRGTGQSTGDYTTASLEDLARDALAGLASLRARADIRRDRIGIAGHSQGGWIAPLAATMSREVRFIMVTSASGLGPMDQSLYDNTNAMRAAGVSDADIEKAEGLRRRMYNGVRSGSLDPKLNGDLAAIASERWFKTSQLPASIAEPPSPGERRFLLFKPVPVWRRVHVPVLAIWGSDDAQVPAEGSEHLIDDALHLAGNRKSEMHLLPGLGHNFLQTKPAVAHDFPRGTPELEPIIADWLSRRVRATPG